MTVVVEKHFHIDIPFETFDQSYGETQPDQQKDYSKYKYMHIKIKKHKQLQRHCWDFSPKIRLPLTFIVTLKNRVTRTRIRNSLSIFWLVKFLLGKGSKKNCALLTNQGGGKKKEKKSKPLFWKSIFFSEHVESFPKHVLHLVLSPIAKAH